jgi:hydrogenase small subunit
MSVDQSQTAAAEPRPAGPDFLELVRAGEPGAVISDHADELRRALRRGVDGPVEIAWLQGQSCSGCSVSLLQSADPSVEETLSELRDRVSFHSTLMTDAGDPALSSLGGDPDVLVVEGAIPTQIPRAATLGVDERGEPKPVLDWVLELGERADVIVAAGSCAAFGGLPAAGRFDSADVGEGPTGARGLQFDGREDGGVFGPGFTTGRDLPVINVSGCPLYAEHLLLTLATVLNGHRPALDEYNRPLPLFGPLVHDDCELREAYECGDFAAEPGDDGCLYDAGCAGVYANCDGSMRLRNGGTTVCRQVGAPCIGCVEPAFWDRFSPFYDDVRDDDGEPATPGDDLAPRPEATPDRGMSAVGLVTAALAGLVMLPFAPFAALAWLYDRVRDDREPTGWEDFPL